MNLRKIGVFSMIFLSSCHAMDVNESNSINFAAKSNDFGNFIRVSNKSRDDLCIPSRFFDSKSGTLSVFENRKILMPNIQDEYGENELYGTFYIVPGNHSLDISIDFSQYKFVNKKYDYSITVLWYFCRELSMTRFSELAEKRVIKLRGLVKIPPS
jgi:hypothetical protein